MGHPDLCLQVVSQQVVSKQEVSQQVVSRQVVSKQVQCTVKPVLNGHSKRRPKISFQD